MQKAASGRTEEIPAVQDLSLESTQKIFFGHQSVGDNIVQGLQEIASANPGLKLRIVNSANPESVVGPAFVEAHLGQNGDPQSKDNAFRAVLDRGLGREGGIAMYKYCYVDIAASTNVSSLFENYSRGIEALKLKYPLLGIVHITVPLRTVEPDLKAWVKEFLGRTTERDINRKRNEYNNLLKETYAGIDPIFDLAESESTHRDGSRASFRSGNDTIFDLAPEYTVDGGHLNEIGRRVAARELLNVLAKISSVSSASTHFTTGTK